MSDTIKLPKETAVALTSADEIDGWKILELEITDEWRWGNRYRVVVEKDGVPGIWAYDYQTHSGDERYSSVEDEGDEVTFYRVLPWARTVVEYVLPERMK